MWCKGVVMWCKGVVMWCKGVVVWCRGVVMEANTGVCGGSGEYRGVVRWW
jgi:hypothetical protein